MKTIKVEVPFELWVAFKKAFPRRGEGTEVLRNIISLLVEHGKEKNIFGVGIADLMREMLEESAKDEN